MEVSGRGWEDNSGIGFPPIRAFVVGGHRGLEAHREGAWRMHQLLTGRDAGEGYTAIIQQRMHHPMTIKDRLVLPSMYKIIEGFLHKKRREEHVVKGLTIPLPLYSKDRSHSCIGRIARDKPVGQDQIVE